ncbi:hypothetical protein [Nocardia asiatica]|uniref:hypothetical protein n=1 Tax=Nocardia asiatica TaxID=209252 RepID=UPI003EE3CF9C
MTDPTRLDSDDRQRLDAILGASADLARLAGPVRSFATMITRLHGGEMERWMEAIDTDNPPALRSFVRDLRRDTRRVVCRAVIGSSGQLVDGVGRVRGRRGRQ